MKVVIKPFLVKMMKDEFPEFEIIDKSGLFYLFRKKEAENLYSYIQFQREGAPYNQLLITVSGVGCNKRWDGYPSTIIGKTRCLGYMMSNGMPTSNIGWVKYGETEEEINKCMYTLKEQIETYVLPYFEEVKLTLESDKLFQNVVETMSEELPKETKEDLEEIKKLLISGQNTKAPKEEYRSISDYKNYKKWWDLISKDLQNDDYVDLYILNYLKDYLNFYF